MAGPLLSRDKQTSRRRWVIVAAVITVIIFLFSATSQYYPRLPHHLDHPPPPQSPDHLSKPIEDAPAPATPPKPIASPQFVKPKDIPIVGFIFFGRKSRVEILRCYVEVRSILLLPARVTG
jgi:hypothetical protein